MVNTRAKRKHGAALTVVPGDSSHRADQLGGLDQLAGADQLPDVAAPDEAAELREQLAELREQLTAVGVPAETLAALDGSGDVEEALHRLTEAGILPSLEEALAGLLDGWKSLLKRRVDPLSAELCGAEFLAMVRQAGPDEADQNELLAGLIEQAAGSGAPEALAMLRVIAVLGPLQIRPAAAAAAGRLATGGLIDPPWVRQLGTPQVGACFGYVDELGAQEGVVISFVYGRKPHALVVLIDHGLGGGVKDCFCTHRPDQVRADYQTVATRHRLDFRDYQPAEARAILAQALAAPPCPVELDQVEDVENYLGLLRQRVALLPAEVAAIHRRSGGRSG